MKKYLWLLGILIILALGFFLGAKVAAGGAGILTLLFGGDKARKSKKEKRKEAQKNIDKAGEDIKADEHDADSSLDKLDNVLSDDNGGEG